ncbi:MAG: hypothetical protein EA382_04760, partial [Spirochaetaceae bacterium]
VGGSARSAFGLCIAIKRAQETSELIKPVFEPTLGRGKKLGHLLGVLSIANTLPRLFECAPHLLGRVCEPFGDALASGHDVAKPLNTTRDLRHHVAAAADRAQLLTIQRTEAGNLTQHPGEHASQVRNPLAILPARKAQLVDQRAGEAPEQFVALAGIDVGVAQVELRGKIVSLTDEP